VPDDGRVSSSIAEGDPEISVVVTVVEGPHALRECLTALGAQSAGPRTEVLVPYDDSIAWVDELVSEFPWARSIAMGQVETERPKSSPSGQHELFDRRRAKGLARARGRIICILEDRGVPEQGWCAAVAKAHRELPHAAIGGAVECGMDHPIAWAVYFCDFSRYQLPFPAGPREYVTDVNISYKRDPLFRVHDVWKHRYHETTVHWRLVRDGETLYLTPDLVVRQRRHSVSLKSILRERVEWGRLFAYTRAMEIGRAMCLAYAVTVPLLPPLLFVRHARTQISKRVRLWRFVSVSPLVALLLVSWSAGELVGYLTRRP